MAFLRSTRGFAIRLVLLSGRKFRRARSSGRRRDTTAMLLSERVSVWKTAYNTANLPVGMTTPPDAVSKWLVITRAAVFSMTGRSGLIGGLPAVGGEGLAQVGGGPIGGPFTVNYGLLLLAVLGLVVAHAANN